MPLHVLLIDDSPSIRTILKLYLMGRDYAFLEAPDGAQGLRAATENAVDLVIADYDMPVMNGIEFTRRLRESSDPRRARLPVILLTGHRDLQLRTSALEAGATDVAHKPIDRGQLTATVDRALSSVASGSAA